MSEPIHVAYAHFDQIDKLHSINFAGDVRLTALIVAHLQGILQEISETEPGIEDPALYTRNMTDLHARKEEWQTFLSLLQEIKAVHSEQEELKNVS